MNRLSEFLLKDEFEYWLVLTAKISQSSAKSYLSYISSVNKIIKFKNERDSLFFVMRRKYKENDITGIETLISLVIEQLSNKKGDVLFNRSLKTLQNYKSALFQYLEFLIEITIDEDKTDIKQDEIIIKDFSRLQGMLNLVLGNVKEQHYSKADLISTFSSRIKTQDRTYADIFFPTRFISRIFRVHKKQDILKKWLTKLIDSIVIHIENEEVKFAKITALSIINNCVYISYQGKEYLAYTKLADNKTLELFDVKNLSNISIDHIVPLHDVMNVNIAELQTIVKITNELKKYISVNVTYNKLVKTSSLGELNDFIKTIDTDKLLKEIELISSKTNLQLMDRSFNTSKGKK